MNYFESSPKHNEILKHKDMKNHWPAGELGDLVKYAPANNTYPALEEYWLYSASGALRLQRHTTPYGKALTPGTGSVILLRPGGSVLSFPNQAEFEKACLKLPSFSDMEDSV